MTIFTVRNFMDAAVGAVISLAVVVPLVLYTDILEPQPYEKVTLDRIRTTETHVDITASFVKNDNCRFITMGAFAHSFYGWSSLRWEDIDAPEGLGDRLEGHHTFTLRIFFDDAQEPDLVEIRTRHLCGDEEVDKVFLSQQLN